MEALFVGLTTVDVQFLVNKFPNEDSKVKAEKNDLSVGGPATNASVVFSHLGGKSTLLTSIGRGLMSEFIRLDLYKYNVKIIDLTSNYDGNPVFASVITSKSSGSRTVFSYNPPIAIKPKEIIEDIDLSNFDIVLLDGFYPEVAAHIGKMAKAAKIPVVLDGGSWKPGIEKLIDLSDIIICSEHFIPPQINHEALFEYFERHSVKHSAITRGSKSILCHSNGIELEIPVDEVPVVDTLGAGDFFHGAFLYYYLRGSDFVKSLKQATKIAAKSCQTFGTRRWMEI